MCIGVSRKAQPMADDVKWTDPTSFTNMTLFRKGKEPLLLKECPKCRGFFEADKEHLCGETRVVCI